ncbi:MAG: Lrp/AsnC family transcriptional regulator [Bacteroidota bacterium]
MKLNLASVKLDEIDRKILEILQTNAKITNAQLSKDIGLSPAPTLERVKKLENSGIIKSYHAQLDTDKIGLGVHTFVQVTLKGHNKKNIDIFLNEINRIPEVVECHHITGTGDFILKVIAKDISSYQYLMLEKVSEIEVVDSLQSMVILSTFKDSKVIPVPIS